MMGFSIVFLIMLLGVVGFIGLLVWIKVKEDG